LNTDADREAMLAQIGVGSVEDLFANIPPAVRLGRTLDVPPALSEIELTQHLAALAARNRPAGDAVCFLGGGSYDHFIPAVVDTVSSRSEYYTAYTPYQAEASQGSLQAFFEFQTLLCQLTGLDVANASLYEGGSAVAEAILMAMNVTGRTGKVLLAESIHPEYRLTAETYLANLPAKPVTLPTPHGFLDPDDVKKAIDDQTLAVVVQHPNFFGCLEEVEALAAAAKAKGRCSL
jgi:glycine dehydrogenase subunit 1